MKIMKMSLFARNKGFTLVELLVVVAIIGLLASIVFVSLGNTRRDSRDVRRKADIRQIKTAMELCYPDAACRSQGAYYISAGYPTEITGFITVMPKDPRTGLVYGWAGNTGDDQKFCVSANLEGAGFVYATETTVAENAADPCAP